MIRFVSVQIKPYQNQNNLDILVDNNVYQQYFNVGQNLVIEAEFRNTIIQEINLHIFPDPEKEILFKCYNLNELDQEYKRISGKLIKIRNEGNYIIYAALIKSEVPFTRMTITIQAENKDSFKIYYFGVKGKNIEEELDQQENKEQMEKKTLKMILKPGRKIENLNTKMLDNTKMTALEFFNRVNSVKQIKNVEQQSNFQNNKMKIEESQQNESFIVKMQEEVKVKEDLEDQQYIILQDDDENSVELIDEKIKIQQIEKNYFNKQKCILTNIKPNFNNQVKINSQNRQIINKDSKIEYNVFHNMIKYTAQEIDQQFLQFHKTIEESKNVNGKNRLIHRLNTLQY
ncbi:unnamed protein product [Paramecium primaurelia]|uniref:Uncharacterized protein n=1 Tax=Paramecium primaurelia TaxID=5886 RepID=A0A8S1P3L2_PARPR|nr:unnamed protein product [Paramecium primaurelia]